LGRARDGLIRKVELGLLIDAEARVDRALAAMSAIGRYNRESA